jgi:predicted RNase H-like HicB family nuclease
LPGCVTQGETQDAALANIKEAVQAYVGALEVDNLPVPDEHFDARLVTV